MFRGLSAIASSVLFMTLTTACGGGADARAVCGDGALDDGEACDDGNTNDGDGCRADCAGLEACGDGLLDGGEVCDDGNDADGDGCDTNCTVTRCGNGVVTEGEVCDDGNRASGDGCRADCRGIEVCGDALRDVDEACDDGNTDSGDGCTADCGKLERCGDGLLDVGEVCDDGDTLSGDGCRADCGKIEICGDGEIDEGESCDDSGTASGDGCRADCRGVEACGDGLLDVDEVCDDGGTSSGDGCRGDCLGAEVCGDGLLDVDEACDDGGTIDGDGCRADCLGTEVCGDGLLDVDEVCDDGDTDDGDGCRGDCDKLEVCGDGERDAGEACDDGGTASGDGCRGDCMGVEVCGDGLVDVDEACDDGNVASGDGCRGDCAKTEFCGDGELDPGEVCDDGNTVGGDGCRADCLGVEVCGDGFGDVGELCLGAPQTWSLSSGLNRIVPADLDGDGDLDVVAGVDGGTYRQSFSVRYNDGRGNFGTQVTLDTGVGQSLARVFDVAVADVNGDDAQDIVALLDYQVDYLTVHLNDGSGGFLPPLITTFGPDFRRSRELAVVDVNGDDVIDVVVSGALVQVFLGVGDGTFGAQILVDAFPEATGTGWQVEAIRLDDDDHVDLVCSEFITFATAFGVGDGTFVAGETQTPSSRPNDIVAAGDLDHDGDEDMVFALTFGRIHAALNEGGALVLQPQMDSNDSPWGVTTADLNGDGDLDIIVGSVGASVATGGGNVTIFAGRGDGTFDDPIELDSLERSMEIAAADATGDGNVDLIVGGAGASMTVVPGRGDLSFAVPEVLSWPDQDEDYAFASIDVVDLDGDGALDLVGFAHPPAYGAAGYLLISYGDGDGGAGPIVATEIGYDPEAVAVGDLDGDGVLDVAIANGGTNEVDIVFLTAERGVKASAFYSVCASPSDIVAADWDDDGDVDLLVTCKDAAAVAVMLNDGAGAFPDGPSFAVSSLPVAMAVTDIDGDGRLDVATVNKLQDGGLVPLGRVNVVVGTAGGGGWFVFNGQVGYLPVAVAVADLDEDGRPDLLVSNDVANDDSLYSTRNTSLGVLRSIDGHAFEPMVEIPNTTVGGDLVTADINGDGHIDVIARAYWWQGIGVFLGDGEGGLAPPRNYTAQYGPVGLTVLDFDGDGFLDVVTSRGGVAVIYGGAP